MNFDTAFAALLLAEGGYANRDPKDDPGGETMYGITARVARAEGYTGPMRDLPLATAKDIARRRYWDAVRADILPPDIRDDVFDAAYHSGPEQAIKWLQRAMDVTDDGEFGPQTLAAVQSADPDVTARRFLGKRLRTMTDLKNWGANGRGWARRVAEFLEQ